MMKKTTQPEHTAMLGEENRWPNGLDTDKLFEFEKASPFRIGQAYTEGPCEMLKCTR